MKFNRDIEPTLGAVERNPALLTANLILTAALCWGTYELFMRFSGWAMICMVPALLSLFNTLWLMLNPYALIYANRVEIHRNVIQEKHYYFTDITDIRRHSDGKFYVTYTDGDVEPLQLFGIRNSDINKLVDEFLRRKAVGEF